MPIPVARLVTCAGALVTTVFIAGVSAVVAVAAPDDQAGTDSTSQVSHESVLRRTVAALQGTRGSHQPVRRVLVVTGAVIGAVQNRLQTAAGAANQVDASVQSEVIGTDEAAAVDPRRTLNSASGSGAVIQLPAISAFTLPVPTLPGAPATSYSIDLTGPVAAYSTTVSTYETANTLVTDAVTPYSPFGPYLQPDPKPDPQPQLRVFEAEPAVIDVAGGGGGTMTMSVGMPDLSVLQTPLLVPAAIRLAPPRPVAEPVPAGASAQVISAGAVGAPAPTVRGPVTQASVQAAEAPSGIPGTPTGNTALRQDFSQYLRNGRMAEVASVALPGVAGLLALTAAGGMIGYRQANTGRYVRADAARFLT